MRKIILFILAMVLMAGLILAGNGDGTKSYSEMDLTEKTKYIQDNLGTGFNPSNVEVSENGKTFTIKSGTGKLVTKDGMTVILSGGSADASSYDGDISFSDKNGGTITTTSGKHTFGAGGKVTIRDGEIFSLQDVEIIDAKMNINGNILEKGSRVSFDGMTITTEESVTVSGVLIETDKKISINRNIESCMGGPNCIEIDPATKYVSMYVEEDHDVRVTIDEKTYKYFGLEEGEKITFYIDEISEKFNGLPDESKITLIEQHSDDSYAVIEISKDDVDVKGVVSKIHIIGVYENYFYSSEPMGEGAGKQSVNGKEVGKIEKKTSILDEVGESAAIVFATANLMDKSDDELLEIAGNPETSHEAKTGAGWVLIHRYKNDPTHPILEKLAIQLIKSGYYTGTS